MNFLWLTKMAWRDSRRNRSRLFLFMSSIVLGIAALVAINSFGDNMQRDINGEAKKLLGADLVLEARQPLPDSVLAFLDSMSTAAASEVSFASMVLFPENGGSRLVQVRAIQGGFPFYGDIETTPANGRKALNQKQNALVDHTLLLQYNARPGDSIQVGNQTFYISSSVDKVPGQAGISTSIAPPVFIPMQQLDATGLLQKGSRINYKAYYKFDDKTDVDALLKEVIEPRLKKDEVQYDTVAERKQEIGDTYRNLTGFLNLVAFVALLLGCLGVASSVHIYIKDKIISVAILRCLGGKGKQGLGIYLIQIACMGLIGSVVGALLGTLIQFYLPQLFAEFLPVAVDAAVSWEAIAQGILLGMTVSILFALLPLLSIRKISPLTVLRASQENQQTDKSRYLIYGLIVLFVEGFAYLQLGKLRESLFFTGGILLAFVALAGIAQLIIWLVRKYFPVNWSYIWRQSLSNLYRPNNQTLVLVITVGLGTALIATLFFIQGMLLEKVSLSASEHQPNMVLFDIQDQQVAPIADITQQRGLPVMQEVPVVTMRLEGIKNQSVAQMKQDTTLHIPNWVLNREYRVTYRDTLADTEELTAGTWKGTVDSPQDSIFISLDKGIAEDMQVGVGDKITFNVQGALIDTYVGSLRDIDWERMQTNFLVLFPKGVLEKAPKFWVIMTRVDSAQQAASYQQAVVQQFPNVSIIDLDLILQTLDDIVSKVSFVIKFMAFFSIVTGILVLIGSVIISKYQRIQESVLLRTIGASRKQILSINAFEYFFLGSLAALTGILIALLSSWALAVFSFEVPFHPPLLPAIITYVLITLLTVLIGLSNSRSVINRPPLEVLRSEV